TVSLLTIAPPRVMDRALSDPASASSVANRLKVPPVLRKYHFLASGAAVGSWSHTREPARLTRRSPVIVSPALDTQLLEPPWAGGSTPVTSLALARLILSQRWPVGWVLSA